MAGAAGACRASLVGGGDEVSLLAAHRRRDADYTVEMATGLGHLGKVRPLEPPHTQPNFVMREMGYTIARKHAEKLRPLVLLLAFAVPIAARC